MAKANAAALCPGCRAELPHPIPSNCPACDRPLQKPENDYFATPDYLHYQLDDHKEKANSLNPGKQTDAEKAKLKEILEAYETWCRNCPAEDRIASLNDSLVLLKNLLHGKASVEEMRKITSLGKQIGNLAEAIEGYVGAGGNVNVRKARPLQAPSGGQAGGTAPTE